MERIYKLERNDEKKGRAERKDNIVISGKRRNEKNVESKVKKLLRAELRVEAEIKKAWLVGAETTKNKVVLELGSWENKGRLLERSGIWREGFG